MKKRMLLIAGVLSLIAALTVAAILILGDRGQVNVAELNDVEFRTYADEVLGVPQAIREYPRSVRFYIRFRSSEDQSAYDHARGSWLNEEATEAERLRFVSELALERIFSNAYDSLPPEVGRGGKLEVAFYEAMHDCAASNGYVGLILSEPPPAERERLLEEEGVSFNRSYRDRLNSEFDITFDQYLDLRHKCAKLAESYPTLDVAERDRLARQQFEHYWQAAKSFVLANPDFITPRVDPSECTAEFIVECVGTTASE